MQQLLTAFFDSDKKSQEAAPDPEVATNPEAAKDQAATAARVRRGIR